MGWREGGVLALLLATMTLGALLRAQLAGVGSVGIFAYVRHAHSHLGYYGVLFPALWYVWSTSKRGRALSPATLVVYGRQDRPWSEENLARTSGQPQRYADRLEFAFVDDAAHFITDDAPAAAGQEEARVPVAEERVQAPRQVRVPLEPQRWLDVPHWGPVRLDGCVGGQFGRERDRLRSRRGRKWSGQSPHGRADRAAAREPVADLYRQIQLYERPYGLSDRELLRRAFLRPHLQIQSHERSNP